MYSISILIYQPRQIGDVILCIPLLRAIKEVLSNTKVHFLTTTIGKQILINNPYIDYLHVLESNKSLFYVLKFYFSLRKYKFDFAFDMMSTEKSSFIMQMVNSKKIFAFRKRYLNYFNAHVIDELKNSSGYSVYSKILLLKECLKYLKKDDSKDLLKYSQKLEIFVNNSEEEFAKNFVKKYGIDPANTVTLYTVSRREYKIWDPEKYIKIIEFLLEHNQKILFLFGPGEKSMILTLLQLLPEKYKNDERLIVNFDLMNLKQLYGVLKYCKLFIGNDGGPKHLACSAEIPTITIFNSINPKNWTPVNDKRHTAFNGEIASLSEVLVQLESML